MNREESVEQLREEIASRDERIGELENVASYYASRNEELREEVAALKQQNADLQLRVDSLTEQLEKFAPLLAKLDLPQTTGVDPKVPNSGASKL